MFVLLTLTALLCSALAGGIALTHVLEAKGKRRLPTEAAVAVQQYLYVGYRIPGAVIEIGALFAAGVAAALAWNDGFRFWLTIGAAALLLVNVPIFLAWTDRENRRIARWRSDAMPDGWRQTRVRWEASHATRALIFTAAAGLLAGSLTVY